VSKKSLKVLAEEGEAYVENERAARAIEEELGTTTVGGTEVPNTVAAGMLSMLFGKPRLGARLLTPNMRKHVERALRKKAEQRRDEGAVALTYAPYRDK